MTALYAEDPQSHSPQANDAGPAAAHVGPLAALAAAPRAAGRAGPTADRRRRGRAARRICSGASIVQTCTSRPFACAVRSRPASTTLIGAGADRAPARRPAPEAAHDSGAQRSQARVRRAEDVALGHRREQPRRRRRAGPRRPTPARSRRCTPGARPVAASTAASVGSTTAADFSSIVIRVVGQRLQHLLEQRDRLPAADPHLRQLRGGQVSVGPAPSVVRSRAASWWTTATPSALACTSSSR